MTANSMIKPIKNPLAVAVTALCYTLGSGLTQAEDFVLDEIVVTATKRAASAQDIPMSIEAVSGEKLEQQGISNFEDLSSTIPNFSVGEGIATTKVVMRGMGSGDNRGFEQSVGMFIDGVYMPRSRQYIAPFTDVDRVEVLRGPQAVMFGLNATAGSISVISAKTNPGDEFHAELTAEYELEYQGVTTTTVLGGSPTESLGIRLVYQNRDSGKGVVENTFTGDEDGEVASENIRLTTVWNPVSDLTVTTKLEYAEFEQDGSIGEIFGPAGDMWDGDGKLNWKNATDASSLYLMTNNSPGQYVRSKNAVVNMDYALGEHTLTAVVGYSDFEYLLATDLDTTASNLGFGLDASIDETYEQESLELRWTSPAGETLEYIAGVYYQTSDNWQYQPNVFDFTAAGIYQSNESNLQADLWSAFASATWNITESLRLIGGVRYTDEDKDWSGPAECFTLLPDADGNLQINMVIQPAVLGLDSLCPNPMIRPDAARNSTNVMPELVLQWDLNEDIMLYGKLGKSAKAGGFTTGGVEFDDESVLGLELGMKSKLLNGAAEFNVTLFRNEFDDLQLNSFTNDTPPVAVTSNAGSSLSQGLELDGRWAVTEWLMLSGSAAYLDAEYDEFERGPCPVGVATPCDLSGADMPFAAEFSGNLGADMTFAVNDAIDFNAGVTVTYSDEYFTDGALNPVGLQDSWTKVSARLGLESADDSWSLALIGKNLTEEAVLNTTQPLAGRFLGYIGAPRTVTLQGTYRF